MAYLIQGYTFSHAGELNGSAKNREEADKVFDQMVTVILHQLNVDKESSAIVSMYSTRARAGKYLRKVRVSHGENGKPLVEGCK